MYEDIDTCEQDSEYVVYDEFGRSHGVYETELEAAKAAYVLAYTYGHANVIHE